MTSSAQSETVVQCNTEQIDVVITSNTIGFRFISLDGDG